MNIDHDKYKEKHTKANYQNVLKISDLPGGSVVKKPPADAGDTGLVPDLGRFHMLQSNYAWEPQLLSLCSRAWELQLLSPCATTSGARML